MKKPKRGPKSGTPAWDAQRILGFGASEAGPILGLSEYKGPLDIYCEKRGIGEPFKGNEHTKRGKRVEPFIVEDFQEITGIKVKKYPCPMYLSREVPYIFATPDAILEVPNEGLEAKSVGHAQAKKFGEDGSDHVPAHFIAQAQHQAYVMNWDIVHFCVWIDWQPHVYKVQRNEKFIEFMLKAYEELWWRIQNGDAPKPDFTQEHTPGLIRQLYGLTEGKRIELGESVVDLWKRRQQAARIEAAAKKRKDELQAQVEYLMGDAAIASLPNCTFELARSFVEPKEIEAYTRRGYHVLKERKAQDGSHRISQDAEYKRIEADHEQGMAGERALPAGIAEGAAEAHHA